MTYSGFFVRDNLGQVPNQNGTSWSSSPDIIFAGTSPQMNLSTYTATSPPNTGYNQDFGSTVYLNTPNYIYLRALNTNPAATAANPITGRAWFYYAESDLALFPQNWMPNFIDVAGNLQNYQDIVATDNNQVCIAGLPYIWTPPSLQAAGSHYCGISWIENSPVNPPTSPVASFGNMGTYDQLANFVLSNPNMGWRNTTDVSGLGNSWAQTTNITGPTPGAPFNVGVQCNNMPTDGTVGFNVPPPASGGSGVVFGPVQISDPNYGPSVKISNWTAGAQSSITISYTQGATPPPFGSSIVVTLTTPYSTTSDSTRRLIERSEAKLVYEFQLHELDALGHPVIEITPTRVVLVGSQTYTFGT